MRSSFLNIFFGVALLLSCGLFVSCDKVNIPLTNAVQNTGLNLSYIDNSSVSLQTLQVDSFVTSDKQDFVVGFNNDPQFGTIHGGSYTQVFLPGISAVNPGGIPNNTILNTPVSFDSLQVILLPSGTYYGDTLQPINLKVYEMAEALQNNSTPANPNAAAVFYNPRSFNIFPGTIGQTTVQVYPKRGDSVMIRLADTLGIDLLNKLQSGAPEVATQAAFQNYFEGLYIDADSTTTNTIYSFKGFGSNIVMRLFYKAHGLFTIQQHLDFTYNTTTQFNHINYNHTATPLAAFTPSIPNQLLSSAQTANKAYYNSSTGYFIKIGFPDIAHLKSLYPYVRVVAAQLNIPPTPGTYNYPYNNLPTPLYLFQTDNSNSLSTAIFGAHSGPLQNGDLFIDYFYGQTTGYTYDVTDFINSLLNDGNNPNGLSLFLAPTNSLGDLSLERLIVNDQTLTKGIQLKLYVLGINGGTTTNTSNTSSSY